MSIDEFELHYRESMRDVLAQLQSVVLLSAQLDEKIAHMGSALHQLNESTEQFLKNQKSLADEAAMN